MHIWRILRQGAQRAKKKKIEKNFFHHTKSSILKILSKSPSSQNPNKVAGDTQGHPTVPHSDFGGLNFKGLASKYLLLMALPPADDEKMKKKKQKDLGFRILVTSLPYKGEVKNFRNEFL